MSDEPTLERLLTELVIADGLYNDAREDMEAASQELERCFRAVMDRLKETPGAVDVGEDGIYVVGGKGST